MDYTDRILYYMKLFLVHVERGNDKAKQFKIRAYEKAIEAVKYFGKPIQTVSDVMEIQGIGDKIRRKMIEIVETNYLVEAEGLEDVEKVREDLLKVHGIGSKKADQLIEEYNIRSIAELQDMALRMPDFFTESQILGLAYYSDLIQRIPRKEMMEHEVFLREFFLELVPEFSITIVGSYRRGESSSGDIDILLTYHGINYNEALDRFSTCINELLKKDYIVGVLAKGKTKFLGICQLHRLATARRIDILLTPPEELACALLYFTGSKNFNVNFRKIALLKGYTLNEHRLSKLKNFDVPNPPKFETEKDVFDFLGIVYQSPEMRIGPVDIFHP